MIPQPILAANAIHLWRVELDLEPARLHRLELILSADEQARAARFRFAGDRNRFIAGRGLLRELLALYLNASPPSLEFDYTAYGKPFLSDAQHSWLRFNVSHCGSTAVFAIAREREVGVDIERVSMNITAAIERTAALVLSEPERHILQATERDHLPQAFLYYWTRKEAYIKADGRGCSLPLQEIDVSDPAGYIKLNESAGDSREWRQCPRWRLQTFRDNDAVISVAVEGDDWHLFHQEISMDRAGSSTPSRMQPIPANNGSEFGVGVSDL